MFEPGLEDDETFPASGNLFTVGNRTGYFACGCPNGKSILNGVDDRAFIRQDRVTASGI